MNLTLETNITINDETKRKMLQMLGLDHEIITKEFFDKQILNFQEKEDFKILIITRGIVDKFSSKYQLFKSSLPNYTKSIHPILEKLKKVLSKFKVLTPVTLRTTDSTKKFGSLNNDWKKNLSSMISNSLTFKGRKMTNSNQMSPGVRHY